MTNKDKPLLVITLVVLTVSLTGCLTKYDKINTEGLITESQITESPTTESPPAPAPPPESPTIENLKIILYPDKGLCGSMQSPSNIVISDLTESCDINLIKSSDNRLLSLTASIENHEAALFIFDIPENLATDNIRSTKVYLKKVWCNRNNRILYSSKDGYQGLAEYSNTDYNSFVCQKNNIAAFSRIGYDEIVLDAEIIDGQIRVALQAVAYTANNGEIPFEVDEIYLVIE